MKALLMLAGTLVLTPWLMAHDTNLLPRTQIEAIETHTNAVIVKGFVEIGAVEGTCGAVLVVAKESTDKTTREKALGLALTMRGREKTQVVSLVDHDEMDALIKGLEQMASPQWSDTAMPQFEVSYTTRDGMRVTSFATRANNAVEAVLQSGQAIPATVVLTTAQLAQLRNLIEQAKGRLDGIARATTR